MATQADLEQAIRKVLNEGTAYGQRNWAGTSKATLRTAQHLVNILNQQVIPRLSVISEPSAADTTTVRSVIGKLYPTMAAEQADTMAARIAGKQSLIPSNDESSGDTGIQLLEEAETEEERQVIEALLLSELGPRPDDAAPAETEVSDDNG